MSDGSDMVLENAVAVMNSAINISNMAIQNADLALTESSKFKAGTKTSELMTIINPNFATAEMGEAALDVLATAALDLGLNSIHFRVLTKIFTKKFTKIFTKKLSKFILENFKNLKGLRSWYMSPFQIRVS